MGVLRRYVLSHRFKLEERFKRTTDWDFALRFRYRLAFAIPVNRYTVEPGAFFVPLKAEFYMPIGNEVEELFAKRARFTAGLGHVFSKSWTAVLRYAWQRSRDTIGTDFQTTDQFIEVRIKTQVRIGDLLLTRDISTGETVAVTVTCVFHAPRDQWIRLDSNLVVTPEHPIFTPDGWIQAGRLASTAMVSTDRGWSNVGPLVVAPFTATAVFISVDYPHTFIAGESQILVHNKSR